jgi:phosphoribosyl 1,2-cyclic phosphodiesterase
MIEAMTQGGFKKRGVVFCPQDAIGKDSVILKYAIDFPKKIAILKPKSVYRVKKFAFATSVRHIHPAETYGLRFRLNNTKVGLISDTRYFKGISDFYKTDLLIIPVVFLEPRPGVDHLSLVDTEEIIRKCRPRRVILTHFGRTMLRAGPVKEARRLSIRLNTKVEAAYDGLRIAF